MIESGPQTKLLLLLKRACSRDPNTLHAKNTFQHSIFHIQGMDGRPRF